MTRCVDTGAAGQAVPHQQQVALRRLAAPHIFKTGWPWQPHGESDFPTSEVGQQYERDIRGAAERWLLANRT